MFRYALPSAVVLAALVPAGVPGATPPPPDISGHYRIASYDAVIAIGACGGGKFCGQIAALGRLTATDQNNPTPELHDRPLCGTRILDNLAWQNGAWSGSLYDPGYGTTYTVAMTVDKDGGFRVTGRSGTPMLSRTYSRRPELWVRVPEPSAPCNGSRLTS